MVKPVEGAAAPHERSSSERRGVEERKAPAAAEAQSSSGGVRCWSWWLRLPLFKLPPALLPPAVASLPLLLRLLLLPQLSMGLDVWLPAGLPLLGAGNGTGNAAASFGGEKKESKNSGCLRE